MEFLSLELIEKFVSPKDLVTFYIIWMFVKNKVNDHFESIEMSLIKIGKNIQDLQESIVSLEETQTRKINDLGERVTRLEKK